jgi:hypothetical protein
MSQPNPFAQAVQAPAEQAPPAAPAPAPPAQQTNPFGQSVPAQQTTPGQPQYGQPAAAPLQPQYAPPAPTPTYGAQGQPAWMAQPQQQAPAIAQHQYAAPAYGPPAQQQAAPAAPPAALDPSMLRGAPAPIVGEGRGAKLAHMYGRLVLVFPLSITRKPRNPQFITPEQRQRGDLDQEQVTATFVVLDDGHGGMQPIHFGGDPSAFPPVPDTESAPVPYVRKALWVTQSRVISQLRDFLPNTATGQPGGMICGRVVKVGPERNAPWYITAATEAELGLAGQYMQLVAAGTYPHPLA